MAGSIIFKNGRKTHSKVFLAQAKVASSARRVSKNQIDLRSSDPRLLGQCKRMLKITPSAYVFVYSDFGVHVIPAASVVRAGRKGIDTREDYYRGFGSFYEEVYKCFAGDLSLEGVFRDESKMKELCDAANANRVLAVKITQGD